MENLKFIMRLRPLKLCCGHMTPLQVETPKVVLWSSHMTMGEDLLRLDKEKYVIQFWGSTEDAQHKEDVSCGGGVWGRDMSRAGTAPQRDVTVT